MAFPATPAAEGRSLAGAIGRAHERRGAPVTIHLPLQRRRDDRAIAYTVAAAAAFVAAVFTGRVEIAAFGAPFAAALALGRRGEDLTVRVDIETSSTRSIEGDEITGSISVTAIGSRVDEMTTEVLLDPSTDLAVLEPEPAPGRPGLSWSGVGVTSAGFGVRPDRWGRFSLGPTSVRVRDPRSLTHWEATTAQGSTFVVLPAAPRLDRLLEPRSSRTVAGFHLSRRSLGAGLDFAELQVYRPGDRLRDLNRAATARSGTPIVNRYHPERSGEVVILLDTFVDTGFELSAPARRALVIEARAAWAIARAHLAAQDRVGIATVGRIPIWLAPHSGARARYAILESLMSVGAVLDGRHSLSEPLDAGRIPPAALVVFVSPLWSDRYLVNVEHLQARGRETAVLQLDTDMLLGPPADPADDLARRLFRLAATDRADGLRRAGLSVVTWDPGTSLGASVNAASQLQRRRRAARGR